MLVRFQMFYEGYERGDVVEFPDDVALDLLADGWVARVEVEATAEADAVEPPPKRPRKPFG